MEVFSRTFPRERIADDALGFHASSSVMKIGKLVGNVQIYGLELVLAALNLLLDLHVIGVRLESLAELHELVVEPVHGLRLVALAVLDLADSRRFENATARLLVRVHLHVGRVDRRVDHHPGAPAQLPSRRDVDEDGLLVLAEGVDDLGAELEDLAVHVAGPPRESTPVREDHQRQVLPPAEVLDGLRRLEGRVREPDLPGLGLEGLPRFGVGRVGRDAPVDQPGLDGDAPDGNAAELSAPDDDALPPPPEGLFEAVLVEEARHPPLVSLHAGEHVSGIVGSLCGLEPDRPVYGILAGRDREHVARGLGNVGEPVEDALHSLSVALHHLVGDPVGVHDLRASELVLARVHLAPEELVQGRVSSEDHRTVLHLDRPLSQPVEVSADSDRPASDVG
mmetsp:Transcript_23599/g.57152  ORF Transcript_23599/g.57152 Transcript_23599/m.57152 type:complete len:394 (+) Transcript_23599:556-1737(+)